MNSYEKVRNLIQGAYQQIEKSVENETNALKVLNANKQLEILTILATELESKKEFYFDIKPAEGVKTVPPVKEKK